MVQGIDKTSRSNMIQDVISWIDSQPNKQDKIPMIWLKNRKRMWKDSEE